MRKLYTIALYILTPFILLRLFYRSTQRSAVKARLPERFGYFTKPASRADIWLHAVSVGEVMAAIPLIQQLRQRYPKKTIVVTTMTETGSAQLRSALGDQVFHVFIPYDYPAAIYRFLDKLAPRLLIIMETELWPNLLDCCEKRALPIMLANARLSARSLKGYKKIASFMRRALKPIALVATQSQEDAKRFIELGIAPKQVHAVGNIKFDISLPSDLQEKGQQLREQWGASRPVWIAASTHAGEDEQVLAAFNTIKKQLPQCLLLLVPRHPQRFHDVVNLCRRSDFHFSQRSQPKKIDHTIDIMIGDTMGELLLLYAASDVAFIGGSLINHGGHNPIEPAALSLPIVTGPHTVNFAAVNQHFIHHQALIIVNDIPALAQQVTDLLKSEPSRQAMGQRAFQVVQQNRGALDRHMHLIERLAHASGAV